MKISSIIFFAAILTFSFITDTYSQLQDHFHSASINVSVPVTVNWQKTIHKKDQDGNIVNTITNDEPQKPANIQIFIRIEDLKVNGTSFRGKQITNFPVYDEIKSFYGELSSDKKSIDFIEVTYNITKYSIADRSKAYLEETVNTKVRFENVPLKLGGYSYKYGVTKITNVSYDKMRHLEYRGQNETVKENFVSVDEAKITKWSTCISTNFTPGKTNVAENYNDKLAVIIEDKENSKETILMGVAAFMVHGFSQIDGLKVLERLKLEDIKKEIELTQTELFDKRTRLATDKMLEPDVEVILKLEKHANLENDDLIIRAIIRDVSTNQIADPGLIFPAKVSEDFTWEKFNNYIDQVVEFTEQHYLF